MRALGHIVYALQHMFSPTYMISHNRQPNLFDPNPIETRDHYIVMIVMIDEEFRVVLVEYIIKKHDGYDIITLYV